MDPSRIVVLIFLLLAWFYMASALKKEGRWLKMFVPFVILAFAILANFAKTVLLHPSIYQLLDFIENALMFLAAIGFVYVAYSSRKKLRKVRGAEEE